MPSQCCVAVPSVQSQDVFITHKQKPVPIKHQPLLLPPPALGSRQSASCLQGLACSGRFLSVASYDMRPWASGLLTQCSVSRCIPVGAGVSSPFLLGVQCCSSVCRYAVCVSTPPPMAVCIVSTCWLLNSAAVSAHRWVSECWFSLLRSHVCPFPNSLSDLPMAVPRATSPQLPLHHPTGARAAVVALCPPALCGEALRSSPNAERVHTLCRL